MSFCVIRNRLCFNWYLYIWFAWMMSACITYSVRHVIIWSPLHPQSFTEILSHGAARLALFVGQERNISSVFCYCFSNNTGCPKSLHHILRSRISKTIMCNVIYDTYLERRNLGNYCDTIFKGIASCNVNLHEEAIIITKRCYHTEE